MFCTRYTVRGLTKLIVWIRRPEYSTVQSPVKIAYPPGPRSQQGEGLTADYAQTLSSSCNSNNDTLHQQQQQDEQQQRKRDSSRRRTSLPEPRRSTFAPVFDNVLRARSAHPAMAPLPIRQSPSDRAFAARMPPAT